MSSALDAADCLFFSPREFIGNTATATVPRQEMCVLPRSFSEAVHSVHAVLV